MEGEPIIANAHAFTVFLQEHVWTARPLTTRPSTLPTQRVELTALAQSMITEAGHASRLAGAGPVSLADEARALSRAANAVQESIAGLIAAQGELARRIVQRDQVHQELHALDDRTYWTWHNRDTRLTNRVRELEDDIARRVAEEPAKITGFDTAYRAWIARY